jgi:DNA repair protein RadA
MSNQVELEPGTLTGVTAPTIEKIKKAGVHTLEALAGQTPKHLSEIAGIGKDTAEKAINKALTVIGRGYITGKQLYDELQMRTRLSTGAKELDTLLGGGIESETTTEFAGKEGSGKTQICHMLAVQAQRPLEEGGLGAEVGWIDTEDTFRPDRIVEIATALGLEPMVVLSRIHRWKAYNTQDQRKAIEALGTLCHEKDVKLIIVDSMMAHLRSEFLGRGMLSERQNVLGDMLQKLAKICRTYNITAVYTNQVMDNPAIMYGNPEKAIGGHVMGHAATTRVHLRRGKGELRIASLKKSPYLPDGEARFKVTEKGVENVE